MRAIRQAAISGLFAASLVPPVVTAQEQHPRGDTDASFEHSHMARPSHQDYRTTDRPVDMHAPQAQPSETVPVEASTAGHIPPAPPQHPMTPMSPDEMADAMEMDDAAPMLMLRFDRLEYVAGDEQNAAAWKASASFGGDFNKLLIRSEGERTKGEFEHADAEFLWDHAAAAFWNTQVGVRRDFGRGADRTWAAFGVQGLAPYWLEVGATAYVGDAGHTALRLEVDYELSLTQRLILQPRVELNAYGRNDPAARIGSGLSDGALGLRLRYEIRREFAPYLGIERPRLFGRSGDYARADGVRADYTVWVVGLRVRY